jgi:hypothetical protein
MKSRSAHGRADAQPHAGPPMPRTLLGGAGPTVGSAVAPTRDASPPPEDLIDGEGAARPTSTPIRHEAQLMMMRDGLCARAQLGSGHVPS